MSDPALATRMELLRQLAHWTYAASRLEQLDDLASPAAWNRLEHYLGLSVRQHLTGVVERLKRRGNLLRAALDAASSAAELEGVRRQILDFRRQYVRAEI